MRRLVATVAVAAVGAVTGSMTAAAPAGAEDFSRPFTGFAPANTVLRDASPASAGLDPAPIDEAVAQIRGHEEAPADTRFMPARWR